jgi:spermidine synthase
MRSGEMLVNLARERADHRRDRNPAGGIRDNDKMRVAPRPTTGAVTLVALGFASACAQAALLREAMAALGGSELAWGAVLALWLAGMGAGAWAGARRGAAGSGALAVPAVVVAAGVGVVLLRAAPALTGAVTGEAIGTLRAAWVWVAAVFPAAAIGGLAFARLALASSPARAYGLESAGALVGGAVFTFVLAPLGSPAALALALGAVGTVLLAARRARLVSALVLGVAVAVAVPLGDALARAGWRWQGRAGTLAAWRDTPEQRLELAGGSPAALYGDGALLGSFPDEYAVAPRAHLLLLLHPAPRRVLVVGALATGALPALLRHPLARLDVAEDDPALAAALPRWYGEEMARALADPRVAVQARDPVSVVAGGGGWDEILLLDPDPSTLRRARTRTLEFYRSCAAALAPGGIVVVRVGAPDTYLGGAGGRLLAITAATLRAVFPAVAGVPGEEVLVVAAGRAGAIAVDPAVLAQRWRSSGAFDPTFDPEMLPALLDSGRAAELTDFLAHASAPENRRGRPVAVPVAAMLREARGTPPLLRAEAALERHADTLLLAACGMLVALLAAATARPRLAGIAAAAAVGFVSMGWWLALLSAWQATVGSVYSQVGALSAAFMAGVAGGAAAMRGRGGDAARRLPVVLGCGAVLSLLLALELPLAWPRATCVPLLLLGGVLTGAAFPGVAALAGRGPGRTDAGRGFAGDEAGAALAALLVGLVALPLAGMAATAAGLAVIGAMAAGAVALGIRRQAG